MATCLFAHPAVDEEYEQIVMDVWSRMFSNIEGKKVDSEQAVHFSTFMRVPTTVVPKVLAQQPCGYYVEPRLEAAKGPDPTYKIVWLPGLDLQAATHKAKTHMKVIGLMRLKNRFGVRVLQKDEKVVFEALRPDTPYSDIAIKLMFQLFPLPHGTSKSVVSSLLSKWQWSAKPLFPGKSNKDSMAWIVGASTPPEQMVMPGFSMDVLIAEYKTTAKTVQPTHVGSFARVHLLA